GADAVLMSFLFMALSFRNKAIESNRKRQGGVTKRRCNRNRAKGKNTAETCPPFKYLGGRRARRHRERNGIWEDQAAQSSSFTPKPCLPCRQAMGRFFGSDGTVNSRIASKTTLNWASYFFSRSSSFRARSLCVTSNCRSRTNAAR
ncbi:MAG: hypothetical protein HW407_1515, partial [Bacteroidetes bacterium]|nr:hypothetical protein [Bacteroidota bacterium]